MHAPGQTLGGGTMEADEIISLLCQKLPFVKKSIQADGEVLKLDIKFKGDARKFLDALEKTLRRHGISSFFQFSEPHTAKVLSGGRYRQEIASEFVRVFQPEPYKTAKMHIRANDAFIMAHWTTAELLGFARNFETFAKETGHLAR